MPFSEIKLLSELARPKRKKIERLNERQKTLVVDRQNSRLRTTLTTNLQRTDDTRNYFQARVRYTPVD